MRIALAHSHPNTFGGGERAVLEVARGLAPRHQVRLLVGSFRAERTFAGLSELPRQRLAGADWLLARPGADVILTNSFGANLLALRNGGRVVYWVHSLRSQFLQPGAFRPDLLLRRALDFVAVRRAARVVANSEFAAERIRRLYGRPVDGVVYPGVDLDLFQPGEGSGGYALTVGRLSPEKGLERLLELWRDLSDVPLWIVGEGPEDYVRSLRRMASPGVELRGALAPQAVAQAYRNAAVAVFTPHAEEFGIAPVEAMASGVPVVAFREGGLAESVVDGETGFLVEGPAAFVERVRLLLRDAGLRGRLAGQARKRAEEFGWERTVAGIERVFQGVAGMA